MRAASLAYIAALALATTASAATFSVPADDARWTVRPRYLRALDRVHGAGCVPGARGLRLAAGVRAELLFNGTQLRLTGIAPPRAAQLEILLDGEPLAPRDAPAELECAPFAKWDTLDGGMVHNLTIIAPRVTEGVEPGQFLIVNATGIAPEPASSDPSSEPTPHSLPDSAAATHSDSAQPPSSSEPAPKRTPHAALLLAAVLAPLALFLLAGFGLYYYRRRSSRSSSASDTGNGDAAGKTEGVQRSRSFKGMREAHFVMVPATVRLDTPGVVKV